MRERLQKVLAQAGIASRRHCEQLIAEGQVEVNGQRVTEMGIRVDPAVDRIRIGGKPILRSQPAYLLLHKPAGVITAAHDPEGRQTVMDLLPRDRPRVFPVGRLDWDTQGALLLTNDGELANRLLHPRYGITKVYRAKVKGHPTQALLDTLMQGVDLGDGERSGPAVAEIVSANPNNSWVRLIVQEGRNHLVKRMLEAVGHPVAKLRRDIFAGLSVEGLPLGEYRVLTKGEVDELRGRVELAPLPPRGPKADLWDPVISRQRESRPNRKGPEREERRESPTTRRPPAREGGAPGRDRRPPREEAGGRDRRPPREEAGGRDRRPPREEAPRGRRVPPTVAGDAGPFGPWHPRRRVPRPDADESQRSPRRPPARENDAAHEAPRRKHGVRHLVQAESRKAAEGQPAEPRRQRRQRTRGEGS